MNVQFEIKKSSSCAFFYEHNLTTRLMAFTIFCTKQNLQLNKVGFGMSIFALLWEENGSHCNY